MEHDHLIGQVQHRARLFVARRGRGRSPGDAPDTRMKRCFLLTDALASGNPFEELVQPEALPGSSLVDV
ncbi:MAG TPA: hypothetical protein VK390_14755 [Propionibacteriaceae bacterium]|nr:hypothetical protein [Propionibacteriaceae bacterium]HLM22769.1 hypothetical protein [Propionibacteriaceae bacterium]